MTITVLVCPEAPTGRVWLVRDALVCCVWCGERLTDHRRVEVRSPDGSIHPADVENARSLDGRTHLTDHRHVRGRSR